MKFTLNGRSFSSASQLTRELERSIKSEIERKVRAAAPPGVRVQKTSDGYTAEGSADAINRMVKRLGR